MTMTETPEFTTAIRGYDRLQVDEHVARLERVAAEAEERAQRAEAELETVRHTTVGPRVGEILELAVTEAKDIQDRAKAEGREVVKKARAEADKAREKVRAEEQHARTRIKHEREEAAENMEKRQRLAEREVADLRFARETLLQELGEIQKALAAITETPVADGRAQLRAAPEPTEEVEADAATG